jgi:antitoxin component YwqK of YwqJK toxin-antitoxin module
MEEQVPHGLIKTYREDGSVLTETTYEQGVRNGPYRDYWSDGRLACEGQYVFGVQEGEWRFYWDDGRVEVILFKHGKEIIDWDRFFGTPRP